MSNPLIYSGKWHGKKVYFGLHYDLHAGQQDTDLGARCSPRELKPLLRMMAPDFVQTDCKGHPGMTSWYSKTPGATVSPGVVKDAMRQWRAATRELGMPLHCHYSGIWDAAAGAKHPSWTIRGPDGKPVEPLRGKFAWGLGGVSIPLRIAYNDPPGTWTLVVTDIATGVALKRNFNVE